MIDDFTNMLTERTSHINKILSNYLPAIPYERSIEDAMNYSVNAGGKRLRAILLLEFFRLFSSDKEIEENIAQPFAAGIEMLHTYSLVHDDLPAMDNDFLRRGMPTTHAAYGETMGILAGDALLNYSFETLISSFGNIKNILSEAPLELYRRISNALVLFGKKAGISGMITGQVLDTCADASDATEHMASEEHLKYIKHIYSLKTGALFESAFLCGSILGGATDEQLSVVARIAYNVGLAFQIKDDILDMTSTNEILGKDINSDERNGKATYSSIAGIKAAEEAVNYYSTQALELLDTLPSGDGFLFSLIEYMTVRKY